jgi:vacuolar-type H+-ATPase subunit B/Vma2
MYIDYYKNKVNEFKEINFEKQMAGLQDFKEKLNIGINYYKNLFANKIKSVKTDLIKDFETLQKDLDKIKLPVQTKI